VVWVYVEIPFISSYLTSCTSCSDYIIYISSPKSLWRDDKHGIISEIGRNHASKTQTTCKGFAELKYIYINSCKYDFSLCITHFVDSDLGF